MNSNNTKYRLMIISNRLPVIITEENGALTIASGSGGLVTALAPILKNRGGIWIGWPGQCELSNEEPIRRLAREESIKIGFRLCPVFLTSEESKNFYEGFSNEVIWPLFHDLQSECQFKPNYWQTTVEVSQKFAAEIKNQLQPGDFIWIHDYHLMLVGQEMKKLNIHEKSAFFLHIPFPCLDIFIKLPWRFQILRALLEYDLVGFQTRRDLYHFIQCVKFLLPSVKRATKKKETYFEIDNRKVLLGAFPISIDFREFSEGAGQQEVSNQIGINLEQFKGQKVVFSCDRLDISKGIPYRLEAIRYLLKNYPDMHGKVVFFQVVIPSRVEIPRYQELKKEIDQLVGEINSQFSQPGWVPIQYLYRPISKNELLAFYRKSEIALITPVKDGMNLVAKEYVASNIHEDGVLILSEFAGAALQLQHGAFLVNPYDVEGLANTIHTALTLSNSDRKKRMRKMRQNVRRYDIFWWLKNYLNSSYSKELHDFPIIQEYIPPEDSKCS